MPGSFESSAARSSMAPTLERKLEGQIQAACELAHLSLRELRRFLLRFVYGDQHEIFQHLDVLRIGDARIDLHARDGTLSVGLDRYHSSARCRRNGLLFQLGLHLLDARLHLLPLLEDLREVCHCSSVRRVNRAALDRARRLPRPAPDPSAGACRFAPPSGLPASCDCGSNPVPSLPSRASSRGAGFHSEAKWTAPATRARFAEGC